FDEPDYDRDEEERLSGKGTPDRLYPSRPPSSASSDPRPPHRTNGLSASPAPSLPGTVERRSTGASGKSNGVITPARPAIKTGYTMNREMFNRSPAYRYEEPKQQQDYVPERRFPSPKPSEHREHHISTAMMNHRPIKIRDGMDRHPEVRDVIDQSEEILDDLDSMLEEHLSFDEARRKIMDKNLTFRQYAKLPYDNDDSNYEIIEEVYERRVTKEKTIIHLEEVEPRVEVHRDEVIVHRGEGDTVRLKDPEVASRMKKLVKGRSGTVSPPLFQDIIVEDLKKASKHGVREANLHRRRKAEEVYQWTLSEIDRLQRELAPERCIQHIPVYAKDNFSRIPEWKRRLVAKRLSQESIREETYRLWDEFDEWLRVNDPTWKPGHTEIEDQIPMIR
ncbi:hypothetical protein PFISCL1PPCAC_4864, partial [Pristionchus fissidentatus]